MKRPIFLLVVFAFIGCSNASHEKNNAQKMETPVDASLKSDKSQKLSALKSKLIGAWTDGSSGNSTFDINEDSIYYTDQFKSYKYLIGQDSIKILYPDFEYNAKFHFIKDTLIMDSHDYGTSKFWKFKN